MPLVEITLRKGRSPQQLRAIGDAVHDALIAQANVPADDRFQIFHEVEPHALIAHPTYGGVNRSDDLVIVRITLNAGRTLEIKKKLYADIVARMGIRPDDVLISLVEVTKENWSFGNGVATYG
ncbi:MAG: tautomerase family protein [Thermoanaerobaculia bacterium]|nr:tautomerase family protein [Thermoanaerobaculia bacterium]